MVRPQRLYKGLSWACSETEQSIRFVALSAGLN